jgi:hypothetical protein
MSGYRIGLTLFIIVVSVLGLYVILAGASSSVRDDQLQKIVYVDTKSGKAFMLSARISHETNPETGEKTLIPGMYCEKCASWKPVGSMEALQTSRAVRKCPVHKSPLLRDGPLPEISSK